MSDIGEFVKQHKIVVGLMAAAVAGYALYTYMHKGSSTSGTASGVTGTATSGSPQYLVPVVQSSAPLQPTGTASTPTTNLGGQSTAAPPTLPANPPPPTTQSAITTSANQYPTFDIGGQQLVDIGQLGAKTNTGPNLFGLAYNGPQVGYDAPVLFGSPQAGASQGMQNVKPGAQVYVPASFASAIGK